MPGKIADIIVEVQMPLVDFKIPFEVGLSSLLMAVAPNRNFMDNELTMKLSKLVEDPGTHPLVKVADETLVQTSNSSRPVRCLRMYWTCVSNLPSKFSCVCHEMRMRHCDI